MKVISFPLRKYFENKKAPKKLEILTFRMELLTFELPTLEVLALAILALRTLELLTLEEVLALEVRTLEDLVLALWTPELLVLLPAEPCELLLASGLTSGFAVRITTVAAAVGTELRILGHCTAVGSGLTTLGFGTADDTWTMAGSVTVGETGGTHSFACEDFLVLLGLLKKYRDDTLI